MNKLADFFPLSAARLERVQCSRLDDLLTSNVRCAYGVVHGFESINSAADYKKLPFMKYDDVAGIEDYWTNPENFSSARLIAYFVTSGSTAEPKKIPVTSNLVREKIAAFSVFWESVYAAHPALKSGNFIANFADSGTSKRSPSGVLEIAETTFWNQRMQGFQSASRWPLGKHLSAITSADLRYYAGVRLALQGPLHCMMSLNPSTLARFCRVLDEQNAELASGLRDGTWGSVELDNNSDLPQSLLDAVRKDAECANKVARLSHGQEGHFQLKDLWPELELIICWQSDLVEPYLRLLRRHADGIDFRDYITQASECMMAIPVDDNSSGGLLAFTSHYFEFIPESNVDDPHPEALPAWEIEAGEKYEVVVSTGGGLYRYRTSDCVLVNNIDSGVPHLSFQYRVGRTSSITGEKLTEQQVLSALSAMLVEESIDLSRVVVYPRTGEQPHYAILTSEEQFPSEWSIDDFCSWSRIFDAALGDANGEYRDKRDSERLGRPIVITVSDIDYQELQNSFRAAHVGDEQFKPGVLRREHDLDAGLSSARNLGRP